MGAVNPNVVRTKYDRELGRLQDAAARFRSRGVFVLEASFPAVLVGFAAPQLSPSPMVVGVLFDYTNFDVQPPSVRFVNPFTGEPYSVEQLPTRMLQTVESPVPAGFPIPGAPAPGSPEPTPEAGGDGASNGDEAAAPHAESPGAVPLPPGVPRMLHRQELIQAHVSGGLPFLCLPGVREFHQHPAHTGQPWELERPAGAGGLVRLIEIILKYAVEPIDSFGVNLVPQIGFNVGNPPL